MSLIDTQKYSLSREFSQSNLKDFYEFVFPRILPDATPSDSLSRECGQEENADPFFSG